MKFSALSRTGFAVALSAVLASMVAPTQAETLDNMFAKVSPSVRDRMFFRLNYIYANVKTTSGNAYDVTGPVLAPNDIPKYLAPGNTSGTSQGAGKAAGTDTGTYISPYFLAGQLNKVYGNGSGSAQYQLFNPNAGAVAQDAGLGYTATINGLGTPGGIKAKSDDSAATPALSLGYYLTDDYTWFVEAYVLAAPLSVSVKGDGVNGSGSPNGINGVDIIKTKLLPPTALLGYYFGKQGDRVRPFAGIGASYAIFFDVRATQALNEYQGGGNAGDTTISIKNALGFGPFLGVRTSLDDEWHMNFSVGKLRYKTDATLVTRNTTITSNSAVIRDFGPNVVNVNVNAADSALGQYLRPAYSNVGVVTALMCDLAATKYHNNNCSLGTFERKQNTVLDNTMFMFSVGRSF